MYNFKSFESIIDKVHIDGPSLHRSRRMHRLDSHWLQTIIRCNVIGCSDRKFSRLHCPFIYTLSLSFNVCPQSSLKLTLEVNFNELAQSDTVNWFDMPAKLSYNQYCQAHHILGRQNYLINIMYFFLDPGSSNNNIKSTI